MKPRERNSLSLYLSVSLSLSLIVARGYVMRPISTGFSSSVNEVYILFQANEITRTTSNKTSRNPRYPF